MTKTLNDWDGTASAKAWVLYDGTCGFCKRWVGFWAEALRRREIAVAPLQLPWVRSRLGIAPERLLDEIRLFTREGKLFSGADVYLQVWRQIWWAWPLYVIFSIRGCNRLIHWGYRAFARNRNCTSGVCKVPGMTRESEISGSEVVDFGP